MEQLDLFSWRPCKLRMRRRQPAREWKIVSVRETESDVSTACECPAQIAEYWRKHVVTGALYNPDVECLVVLLLSVRGRTRGHHVVSVGSLTETLAYPREVFRAAIIGAAHSIVLMHNHPSDDCAPSGNDLRLTRQLIEAGRILKIEVVDHIIVGRDGYCSLRDLGCI